MYGFTIACWIGGVRKIDLFLHMMAQPPWDTELQVWLQAGLFKSDATLGVKWALFLHDQQLGPTKPFYILHYTYGMDYKLTGGLHVSVKPMSTG
jgi:hypothetical protein